jgi:hypothetical protein
MVLCNFPALQFGIPRTDLDTEWLRESCIWLGRLFSSGYFWGS